MKPGRDCRENPKPDEKPLSIQPYEILTVTVRGKYFFDPYFGGALDPGQAKPDRFDNRYDVFYFRRGSAQMVAAEFRYDLPPAQDDLCQYAL